MKIAILGAGISGLSLTRFLVEGGYELADITLFEAAPEVGGLCRSGEVEGYTYDLAGGHILYSRESDVMQWMKDCAGGDDAFVRRDRNTKIRFGDRWVHYPFENGLGDLPPQANFDCLSGYVRAWHARERDGSSAPADFQSWVRWRFGDGIAKHFMDPYNLKIWKRELGYLSSDWVADRVPDAPIEDVIAAAIGLRTEGYQHQALFYYPRSGGFQAITDGIASRVLSRVRLSTPVTELTRSGEGWRVNGEEYDCVVSTLPLTYLPGILGECPDDFATAARGLEYNSLVTYLLALDREEHPELSWIYLPHDEQGPANRVTYFSNYSEQNAPEGKTSLLCEVTYPGGDASPGPGLEREVVDGLVHAALLRREEVLFGVRAEVSHAYVVFDAAYERRRRVVFDWMEAQGLIPLGRFGRFEYDNSDHCVFKARKLAGQLLERAAQGGA